ncbi:DUF4350 domain-containing protein [Nesterenkonia halobia]|uniref:DUF4350 domain-containing protein n=1 Tax=Nesterenkonia halobia TaxID=37922 RepID=A0ABP6R6Z8_9MICC
MTDETAASAQTAQTAQSAQTAGSAAPAASADRSGATVESGRAALRSTWRRWQFWVLLVVLGTTLALAQQLLTTPDVAPYSLGSTEQDGYRAVAEVLEDQGVTIHEVSGAEQLRSSLSEHPEATLVGFEADWPMDRRIRSELVDGTLAEETDWQGETVFLSPSGETLDAVGSAQLDGDDLVRGPGAGLGAQPPVLPAGPACPSPAARSAGSIAASGDLYRTDLPSCFARPAPGDDGGPAETGEDAAAASSADETAPETPETAPAATMVLTDDGVVFGSPDAFTNSTITDEGHAALGLWLFGRDEELIWYRSTAADVSDAAPGSAWDHLPDWVTTLSWWLVIVAGLLILVAGRRRGPIVSEPLPVQVPAAETAEGRARLYQQADAVDAAARTLRSAHMLRLARLLRLGPAAEEAAVVHATATTTGREPRAVARMLDAAAVTSSSDLLRFAQELAVLEDEVRIRSGLGPRRPDSADPTDPAESADPADPADPADRRDGSDGLSRD